MRQTQGLKSVALGLLTVACSVMLVKLQQARLQTLKNPEQLTPEIVQRQAIAEQNGIALWKKLPAYGYDNLLSNWIFLRFLQYFGDDDARSLGNYELSADYFDVMVDLDPWFVEGYYYLSSSSSLYAGTPAKTVDILNRGLAQMSPRIPKEGYYIWRMKATDEHLFLGDVEAAIQSHLKAAEWASYYNDQESSYAMQASKSSAAFLIRDPRSIMAQVTAWSTVLGQARDQKTQQRAISELEKLGVEVRIDENGAPHFKVPPEILEKEKEALNIE